VGRGISTAVVVLPLWFFTAGSDMHVTAAIVRPRSVHARVVAGGDGLSRSRTVVLCIALAGILPDRWGLHTGILS